MKWIEWENSIINLRHVKSIYYTKDRWDDSTGWSINILMNDKEGKYVRHFESEEECKEEFERIKGELEVLPEME